jgi:dipeptidase E
MGETRETRIKEFHAFNSQGVLGLREGSWLRVQGDAVELCGPHTAPWFTAGQEAVELAPGPLKLS